MFISRRSGCREKRGTYQFDNKIKYSYELKTLRGKTARGSIWICQSSRTLRVSYPTRSGSRAKSVHLRPAYICLIDRVSSASSGTTKLSKSEAKTLTMQVKKCGNGRGKGLTYPKVCGNTKRPESPRASIGFSNSLLLQYAPSISLASMLD
jgi:hypothetical protein